jgi:hypothetical protein
METPKTLILDRKKKVVFVRRFWPLRKSRGLQTESKSLSIHSFVNAPFACRPSPARAIDKEENTALKGKKYITRCMTLESSQERDNFNYQTRFILGDSIELLMMRSFMFSQNFHTITIYLPSTPIATTSTYSALRFYFAFQSQCALINREYRFELC